MADPQTTYLNLYRIGAASDNVGVHMIGHYNANMNLLDSFIAAHDVDSITLVNGMLTVTSTDGSTLSANLGVMVSGSVAPAFDQDVPCTVGALVIHDGTLYECTTAHSGAWDDDDFTATTVAAILANIESALANKQPKTLATAITVDGTSETTVEGALGAINTLAASNKTNKQDKTLSAPITVEGVSKTTVEGALGGLNDYADDITDAVDAIVNVYGAKNLLPYPYFDGASKSDRGVTYTVNSDGSISLSGTANDFTAFSIFGWIEDNKYSGLAMSGGINSHVYFRQRITNKSGTYIRDVRDSGNGALVASIDAATEKYMFNLSIDSGTNVTGMTFKPMLRDARIKDDTYEPYAKTNQELTPLVDGTVDVISKNGAKNLLNNIYTSQTYHGMTITVSDGVMSFSGVASEETNLYVLDNDTSIESGQLKISGCPTGGGTTYYIAVLGNSKNTWISEDDGAGAIFNYNKSTHVNLSVYIHIANGTDMTGKVFKPMITLASQPDSDYAHYVPYAMTNRELTEVYKNIFGDKIRGGSFKLTPSANHVKIENESYTGSIPASGAYCVNCMVWSNGTQNSHTTTFHYDEGKLWMDTDVIQQYVVHWIAFHVNF